MHAKLPKMGMQRDAKINKWHTQLSQSSIHCCESLKQVRWLAMKLASAQWQTLNMRQFLTSFGLWDSRFWSADLIAREWVPLLKPSQNQRTDSIHWFYSTVALLVTTLYYTEVLAFNFSILQSTASVLRPQFLWQLVFGTIEIVRHLAVLTQSLVGNTDVPHLQW